MDPVPIPRSRFREVREVHWNTNREFSKIPIGMGKREC